jgi:hypothetical protein
MSDSSSDDESQTATDHLPDASLGAIASSASRGSSAARAVVEVSWLTLRICHSGTTTRRRHSHHAYTAPALPSLTGVKQSVRRVMTKVVALLLNEQCGQLVLEIRTQCIDSLGHRQQCWQPLLGFHGRGVASSTISV